jgi:acylphosphatase
MPNTRFHVVIDGRVQGVFFRAETQKVARTHHLTGWVRNLPDGRVEAVFEGAGEDVEQVIAWCRRGPPGAVVREVTATREEFAGEFDRFMITY